MADNEILNKAQDIFSKKYGPLPFGVWLVIAAGAAFMVRKVIMQNSAAKDVESAPEGYVTDENGNVFPSAYKGTAGGLPFGSGSNTSAGATGTPVTPITEINNEGWFRRAVEKLTKAGMWDAVTVQTALMTYISGGTLDQRQRGIVNQAILLEGQPPINVTPGKGSANTGPAGATQTPYLIRFVQNAGNGGWWMEYSDGSKRTVKGPKELAALKKSFPGIPSVALGSNDPFWRNQNAPSVINYEEIFPAGKNVTRLVKNQSNGGWWMVYSDNSIRTVKNTTELKAIQDAMPGVSIISLPGSDPFWRSRNAA